MKNLRTILSIMVLSLLAVSCVKDDTTMGNGEISIISIDSTSIQTEYNINKNDVLVIEPKVSQTYQMDLKYTWEMDLKTVSNAPVFEYNAKELGTYKCRLIVENNHGKSFFNFVVNVNTPYEEGLTLLSKDKNGKGKISFLLFNPKGEAADNFTKDDCFAVNNPDEIFVSNPVDIVQSSGKLIMACQGDASKNENATLYYLHEKTMVVENMVTAPEYPDFKPVRLAIPSQGAWGVVYPILCENGKVYEFSPTEGAVASPVKLPYTYSKSLVTYDEGTAGTYSILFWDKDANALCQVYRGYGPFYCSREYNLERAKFLEKCANDASVNYFNGKKFANMTLIRKTEAQSLKGNSETLVLTTGGISQKVRLMTTFWSYNFDSNENVLVDNGGFSAIGIGSIPVNENTPTIANDTYKSFLFGDGNKVRSWNYTSSQKLKDAPTLLTVGSPSAIITNFEISADHKTTYVAFYEPSQEGNNGSVWAFDTDKGTIIKKYDNVCYQPTKLIYKKK